MCSLVRGDAREVVAVRALDHLAGRDHNPRPLLPGARQELVVVVNAHDDLVDANRLRACRLNRLERSRPALHRLGGNRHRDAERLLWFVPRNHVSLSPHDRSHGHAWACVAPRSSASTNSSNDAVVRPHAMTGKPCHHLVVDFDRSIGSYLSRLPPSDGAVLPAMTAEKDAKAGHHHAAPRPSRSIVATRICRRHSKPRTSLG
jgi:hypothetical protein